VEVTDQRGIHLDGVNVNLTCYPEGLVLNPTMGTTVGGFIDVVVEHPSAIENGFDSLRFNIVASVELEGYEPTTGMAQIVVVELSPASETSSGWGSSDLSLLLIVIFVAVVVILGLIRLVRGSAPRSRP
jgi:hypothetical protein